MSYSISEIGKRNEEKHFAVVVLVYSQVEASPLVSETMFYTAFLKRVYLPVIVSASLLVIKSITIISTNHNTSIRFNI